MPRKVLLAPLALVTFGASLLLAGPALAESPADGEAKEASTSAEAAGDNEKKAEGSGSSSDIWDTKEDPKKSYRYIGAGYRHAVVPKFILNIFADGGTTVNVPMGRLEFGSRRDRLEYIVSLSYADYSKGDMLFKGKNELDTAYERVSSDLAIIFAKFEILYEIPLDDKSRFALLLGGGVGIGGVIGDLYRTQVYPDTGADPGVPSQWSNCTARNVPNAEYCENDNGHFGNYKEPSWASGGSKPFIFPWIAVPQVSFRYKPIKYLQARADVGFAISSGFYFGASLDYIL
jgi:hypothetical protein